MQEVTDSSSVSPTISIFLTGDVWKVFVASGIKPGSARESLTAQTRLAREAVNGKSMKNPADQNNQDRFVPLFSPRDVVQAGMIEGVLHDAGILCYTNNAEMASVRFGGCGEAASRMLVMVPERSLDAARQTLSGLGLFK